MSGRCFVREIINPVDVLSRLGDVFVRAERYLYSGISRPSSCSIVSTIRSNTRGFTPVLSNKHGCIALSQANTASTCSVKFTCLLCKPSTTLFNELFV